MMRRGVLIGVLSAFMMAGISLAQAYASPAIGDDCSKISVDYKDDPNLTPQEKTERMNQALMDSLNRYDRCQHEQAGVARGGGAASGSKAGAVGQGEGNDAGNSEGKAGQSSASAHMSGTNPPRAEVSAPEKQTKTDLLAGQKITPQRGKDKRALGNGKIPDDIPPIDNDSVLEEQIRQAAINESDPVIKAKLWNEYRRYKGLPAVQAK